MNYQSPTVCTSWGWNCWWLKSGVHQLRLVLYPIILRVSYIPGGAGFQPSTESTQEITVPFKKLYLLIFTRQFLLGPLLLKVEHFFREIHQNKKNPPNWKGLAVRVFPGRDDEPKDLPSKVVFVNLSQQKRGEVTWTLGFFEGHTMNHPNGYVQPIIVL